MRACKDCERRAKPPIAREQWALDQFQEMRQRLEQHLEQRQRDADTARQWRASRLERASSFLVSWGV